MSVVDTLATAGKEIVADIEKVVSSLSVAKVEADIKAVEDKITEVETVVKTVEDGVTAVEDVVNAAQPKVVTHIAPGAPRAP